MLQDFHLHTLVSDGELDPLELLTAAARCGVQQLSITDHDTLGAYFWRDGAVFDEARRLGLRLSVGLELDADVDGVEVHLLGYDVALEGGALHAHLRVVREARFERARREIGLVQGLLGPESVRAADVFQPGRETLMKPHFIHPLLERGHFATYEEANAWYRAQIKTDIRVPKPSLAEAIALVRAAGGWTSLAHPGYYLSAGFDAAARLDELREWDLQAVETDYPYHACSPHKFSREREEQYVAGLRAACAAAGLGTTRGSDSHSAGDLSRVYGG